MSTRPELRLEIRLSSQAKTCDRDKIDFPIFGIFTKTLSTEIKRRSKRTKIWKSLGTQAKSCYARRVGGLEPNAIAQDRPPNRSHMNPPKTTGNQAGEEFCPNEVRTVLHLICGQMVTRERLDQLKTAFIQSTYTSQP